MLLDSSGHVSTGALIKQIVPVQSKARSLASRGRSRKLHGLERVGKKQWCHCWRCSLMITLTCCGATSCLSITIQPKRLIFCTDRVILWNLFRQLRASTLSRRSHLVQDRSTQSHGTQRARFPMSITERGLLPRKKWDCLHQVIRNGHFSFNFQQRTCHVKK